MGVRIEPCHGCKLRVGCEQIVEFKSKASGIGARTVRFDCPKLLAEMRPGRRIMVATPRARGCGHPYGPDMRIENVAVPATILRTSGFHQFSCVIDPGHVYGRLTHDGFELPDEKYRFRRRMNHQRILRFLDEPDREICQFGNPIIPATGTCDRAPDGGECICKEPTALTGDQE